MFYLILAQQVFLTIFNFFANHFSTKCVYFQNHLLFEGVVTFLPKLFYKISWFIFKAFEFELGVINFFNDYVIISFLISFTLICNWPKQWIKLQYGHIQIKVQKLKTNSWQVLKSSSLLPLIVDQLLVLIIMQLYYSFLIHYSEIVFVISWKPLKWVAVVVSNRF